MAVTPRKIMQPTEITTSAAVYYTVPASTRCIIKKLTLTNTTGGALTVSLWLVPSGSSPADENKLIVARSVGGGACYECYEAQGHVLNTGDSLQALASADTSITMQASGIEVA